MNVRKNVLTVILNSSVTRRRASFHLGWVLFFFFIDVFVAPWIWTKVFYLVASCMQVSVLLFFAFLTGPGNTWTQRMVILQVTIFCQICITGLQKLFLATFHHILASDCNFHTLDTSYPAQMWLIHTSLITDGHIQLGIAAPTAMIYGWNLKSYGTCI